MRKSRFPLNLTDRHTDLHTYRRTDISVYRVASLLIKNLLPGGYDGLAGGAELAFAPPPRPHPPPPLPGKATHSSGGRADPGQARGGLGGGHQLPPAPAPK